MKRTVISYKKLDQHKVKIIGFENVGGISEILKELGEKRAIAYMNEGVNYTKFGNSIKVSHPPKYPVNVAMVMRPGSIFMNTTFRHMIRKMKEAGERFTALRLEHDSKKVHEVKI